MSTTSTLRSVRLGGSLCRHPSRQDSLQWSARSTSPADLLTLDQSVATATSGTLHEACRLGDADEAQRLLDAGTNINARDQLGRAALHCAAAGGHADVVDTLLTAGAALELSDKIGMTPLLWAAWFGHVDVLQQLVNHGANVHATNLDGQSLLHCAAVNDHVGAVMFIADCLQQFSINLQDKRQRTALHVACEKGSVEVVDKLLEMKTDVHHVDKYGSTAAHLAALHGHEPVLKSLIEYSVSVKRPDADGSDCLNLAAANGHHKVVKLLLSHGADMATRNTKGMSSLLSAAAGGHVECVKLLVSHKCDVNTANPQGNTALHLAAANNHFKVVQVLIDAHCEVNKQNERSQTALHTAVEQSAGADVVEALLVAGANYDVTEKGGRTALGLASRASMIGIVDLLITAERYQCSVRADKLANDLECSLDYHHCFYQTSCSALSAAHSNSCPNGTTTTEYSSVNTFPLKRANPHAAEQLKDILWKLATKQLRPNEWKKLAKHWNFSEAHLRAIEHQYTGTDSYKQHGYRLLLIWLSCLRREDNPIKQLFVALVAIDRRDLAEGIRSSCNKTMLKQRPVVAVTNLCHIS